MPRPRTLPVIDDGEDYQPPIYFPQFVSKPIWRTYAVLLPETQEIEADGTRYHFTDGSNLIQLLFTHNLLLLVPGWASLPDDLFDVVMASKGHIWCSMKGVPRSLQCYNRGRSTRWIIDSKACWNLPATQASCKLLQSLAVHTQAGTCTTPGSLGLNMLRNTWPLQYPDDADVDKAAEDYQPEWQRHRHIRPSPGMCYWLQETCVGARSEVLADSQEEFPEAWEIDRKNAYGDAFRSLPTGHSECFWREDTAHLATYYASCVVTINKPLDYGLFLVKHEKGVNVAPTSTGLYRTSLWKEEIDWVRGIPDSGVEIEVLKGEGWRSTTRDTEMFVLLMERLRDNAPTEAIADQVKRALVAAIGRLNMPPQRYELTTEQTNTCLVGSDGLAMDLYTKEVIDPRPQTMPHWYSYVAMQVRLALSQEALKWKTEEMLLGTNTDCVYIRKEADVSSYPLACEKKSLPSGAWSVKLLTKVRFPANRHLISTEKIRRPGIRKST